MSASKYCLFLAAFLFLCHPATAAPPDAAPAAYRLTLPCSSNVQNGSPTFYSVTFNLSNATQHILFFAWAPCVEPTLQFQVDHRAPGENPNTDSGWKAVNPIPKPVPKPDASDVVVSEESNRQKIVLMPGQEASFPAPLGFSLAEPGFYRVSLTMTMDAYEKKNSSDTKGRPRRLILRSDHLVVVKKDWGFVSVTEQP